MTSSAPLGFGQAVSLVAGREVRARLRSKSFLFSTGILLLSVLASIVIGGFLSQNSAEDTTPVAVVSGVIDETPGLEITEAANVEDAEQLVRDGDVEAAVVPSDASETGIEVIGLDTIPGGVVQLLSVTPEVSLLIEDATNPGLLYIVSFGFGLIFFISAITFGGMISQSVVEEKQTRVVEILMSAIPVRALLAGKIVGNSLLAFAQILLIAALAVVGLLVSGQDLLLGQIGGSLVWFIVFFAIGFVLLASLFAAGSSLVSRQEDAATITTPLTFLVMIPYFAVIFFNDNDLVMTILSYVPFSAAVGMPIRLFTGDALWWEPLLALAIIIVSTVAVVLLGSRIYSNSLLRMGSRVKLGEALKG